MRSRLPSGEKCCRTSSSNASLGFGVLILSAMPYSSLFPPGAKGAVAFLAHEKAPRAALQMLKEALPESPGRRSDQILKRQRAESDHQAIGSGRGVRGYPVRRGVPRSREGCPAYTRCADGGLKMGYNPL